MARRNRNRDSAKCKKCTKYANFNFEGKTPALYCDKHKQKGMVNVKGKKCREKHCKKKPCYNFSGKPPLCCDKHKENGMVDVMHKICEEKDCDKRATCNLPGETSVRFCGKHKKKGMIRVQTKKCKEDGCSTGPSYNFPEEKIGLYCDTHKKKGMVNVQSKKCIIENCIHQPSYNLPGKSPALFCGEHKQENMVDVIHKDCEAVGCYKKPFYNFPEEKEGKFCGKHKETGMINIRTPRCKAKDCSKTASYGIPLNTPTRCTEHREENMIKNPRKKCVTKTCKNRAEFGIKSPDHCEDHKINDEISHVERLCTKCDRIDVLSPNNLCISFCEAEKKFLMYKHNQKIKENEVFDYIEMHTDHKVNREHTEDRKCDASRVDGNIDCGTHMIIIEVDEGGDTHAKKHCSLGIEGDHNRMRNICSSFGGTPVIFIRYNPEESFKVSGTRTRIAKSRKLKYLCEIIDYYSIFENLDHTYAAEYLFFNKNDEDSETCFPIDIYDLNVYTCEECEENFRIKSIFEAHSLGCGRMHLV